MEHKLNMATKKVKYREIQFVQRFNVFFANVSPSATKNYKEIYSQYSATVFLTSVSLGAHSPNVLHLNLHLHLNLVLNLILDLILDLDLGLVLNLYLRLVL